MLNEDARAQSNLQLWKNQQKTNGIDCTFLAHFQAFAVGTIFLWFFFLSQIHAHTIDIVTDIVVFFIKISGCLFIICWWYHVYGDSMVVSLSIQKIIQSWWMLLIAWWCLENKKKNTFKNVDIKKTYRFRTKIESFKFSNGFIIRKRKIG